MSLKYSYPPMYPDLVVTVLETKKMAESWSDVLKVDFHGATYRLGDTVYVKDVGYGNIKQFRPEYAIVSILQVDGRKNAAYSYNAIKYMCSPSAGGEQELNPNQAFRKKKGVF